MKKNIFITLISIAMLWACGNSKNLSDNSNIKTENKTIVNQETQPVNAYKKEHLYGYKFSVPSSYIIVNKEVKSIDLKGHIKKIETEYRDSITASKLHIIFHPGKGGDLLYEYYQKDKKAKNVKAGHNDALQYTEYISQDGKGHLLKNKIIRTMVIFMNQNEPGYIELIFDRPEKDKVAGETFNKILKDIRKL
jgi:hypothetical protein